MIEQRTIEWHKQRLGKITASEIYVLAKDRKVAMTDEELAEYKAANPKSRVTTKVVPFSDATFTYLNRKVMENSMPLWSKDVVSINMIEEYVEQHNVTNRAMQWGTDLEPMARDKYAEVMGYEVFEVGFIPYAKYPNLCGGSPDGLIREEKGMIEIKCPYTLEKHLEHFLYAKPDDLKEGNEQYYWQCIANMLFTDTEYCDFVSYCPYVSPSKQIKVLRIPRNEDDIKLLTERIKLAVDYIKIQLAILNDVKAIITE
ncbi:MAG: YqaJ viral recombinase family protein [Prevotella sp.]|nr:YqaJ viral recombinase family protein [Prevotella sp.]